MIFAMASVCHSLSEQARYAGFPFLISFLCSDGQHTGVLPPSSHELVLHFDLEIGLVAFLVFALVVQCCWCCLPVTFAVAFALLDVCGFKSVSGRSTLPCVLNMLPFLFKSFVCFADSELTS